MEDRNNRVQDNLQQLQGVKIEALLPAYKLGSPIFRSQANACAW